MKVILKKANREEEQFFYVYNVDSQSLTPASESGFSLP
jgi:hypothetical protein